MAAAVLSPSRTRIRHSYLYAPSAIRRQLHHHQSSTTRYYNRLDDSDLQVFSEILNHDASLLLHPSNDIVAAASVDWTGHYQAPTRLLLRPRTTTQVSALLAHCHKRRLPITPQGGKTGLVGGSVPTHEHQEIILQLQNMNQIGSVDPFLGIVKCQAGVLLQSLQEHCADPYDLLVPLDLGAKGSCQIGGNVATNAGGQYFRKYNSLAANVLGLQVVLADGRILDLNYEKRTNFKDNTGYKLHQLFIGSEGTLGVITGVALACSPLPRSKQAAFVACSSYDSILQVLQKAKKYLGEILAAMEFMDASIWRWVEASGLHKMPMSVEQQGENGPLLFFLLIDTHGSNGEHDQAKWHLFLDAIQDDIVQGVMAQDLQQYQSFWRIRESANPAVAQLGYTYKYDVSLPIAQFQDWIEEMRRERLAPLARKELLINSNWGHILDGNLHFNVTTIGEREVQQDVLDALEPYLFHSILDRGGSISAEHGLGQSKNHLLPYVHDEHMLNVMRSVKKLFDPHMILNPGKFLPDNS